LDRWVCRLIRIADRVKTKSNSVGTAGDKLNLRFPGTGLQAMKRSSRTVPLHFTMAGLRPLRAHLQEKWGQKG
jgi:hypothetical protein